jgi:hypothetical protein
MRSGIVLLALLCSVIVFSSCGTRKCTGKRGIKTQMGVM